MKTKKLFLAYLTTAVVVGASFAASAAEEDFLSEGELEQAFQQAVREFHARPAPALPPMDEDEAQMIDMGDSQKTDAAPQIVEMDDIQDLLDQKLKAQREAEPLLDAPMQQATPSAQVNMRPYNDVDVSILIDKPTIPLYENGVEIALGELRIMVDMENVTLREAVNDILQQAQDKSGPWLVKWRLEPDHAYVMRERVNLTAETTFDNFMGFLAERVNNMTGVQLFTRVFEGARVIVISDTYR